MQGATRASQHCRGETRSEEDVRHVRKSSGCAGKRTHVVLPLIRNLRFAARADGIFSFVIRAQSRFSRVVGCIYSRILCDPMAVHCDSFVPPKYNERKWGCRKWPLYQGLCHGPGPPRTPRLLTAASILEEPSAVASCFCLVQTYWGTVERHRKLLEIDCHCAPVPSTDILRWCPSSQAAGSMTS